MRIAIQVITGLLCTSLIVAQEKTLDIKNRISNTYLKEKAIQFIAQKHEKKKQSQTVLMKVNAVVEGAAQVCMSFLVPLAIDCARSCLCNSLAGYVPDSYQLVDQSYLQINSREAARIGLEGISYIALYAVLYGSYDEYDGFKYRGDKWLVIDGLNASFRYGLVNYAINKNMDRITFVKDHRFLGRAIGLGVGHLNDRVYRSIKEHYVR